MKLRDVPAFANEDEEAAWSYANREEHAEEFARAFAEGRVRTTSIAQRLAAAGDNAMVKLVEQDAAAAKLLAEKRGVPVFILLSDLLHTAIQQEMERAA